MTAYDIIIKPVVTEQSMQGSVDKKYTFFVNPKANKAEIGKAIEEIFGVKVSKVNTVNVLGKTKRMGRTIGKRPDYKKAIVKLAAGESIEFFQA